MLGNYFTRTAKNSRNIKTEPNQNQNIVGVQVKQNNKKAQEISQVNKGGYVYKPPVKLPKSNNSSVVLIKKQQTIKQSLKQTLTQPVEKIEPVIVKETNNLISRKKTTKIQDTLKLQNKQQNKIQTNDINEKKQFNTPKKIIRTKQGNNTQKQETEQKQKQQNLPIKISLTITRTTRTVSSQIKNLPLSTDRKNNKQIRNQNQIKQQDISQKLVTKSQRFQLINFQTKQTQVKQLSNKIQNKKRSHLILFNLRKLFKNKYQDYFKTLLNYSNFKVLRKNNKTISLSLKMINKIINKYEKDYLLRSFMDKLKDIYSKELKIQSIKILDVKNKNYKQIFIEKRNSLTIKIFQNIIFNQKNNYQFGFNKLKKYCLFQSNKTIILGKILEKHYFKVLKPSSKLINEIGFQLIQFKKIKIFRMSQILNSSRKFLINQIFRQILTLNYSKSFKNQDQNKINSKKQIENNIDVCQSAESQKKHIQSLKAQIEDFSNKIIQLNEIKNKSQNLTAELRQKVLNLKQQKQVIQNEQRQNKIKNQNFKVKIDLLNKEIQRSYNAQGNIQGYNNHENQRTKEESMLKLCHQIYMKIYTTPQQQCRTQQFILSLYQTYKLQQACLSRQNIQKWLNFIKIQQIKSQIAKYQGNLQLNENNKKGKKTLGLEQENIIISKFIKSYIKQRYMWQQVKQFVAAAAAQ